MVFLDIMLGAMNGMELARSIRERDNRVQIIFLTGVQDYVYEGYEIGAVRYLLKPVRRQELEMALGYCCEKNSPRMLSGKRRGSACQQGCISGIE